MRISDSPVLKSKTFRALLGVLLTLSVLAGLGYAWLWKVSYTSMQHYEARELADRLQQVLDPRILHEHHRRVFIFNDRKCETEYDCIEVSIANYNADPAVQENAVNYVLTACDGDTSSRMPCQRDTAGLLRKVSLYFYAEPWKHCLKHLVIYRNPPVSVVAKKSCEVQ